MKAFILFLCALFFASPAYGFGKLFEKHCARTGIPMDLAMAVAKQESAMNHLCVNVEGRDYWPETREQAVKIIKKAQKEDKSYDVGLMQINSQWIKAWKMDPVDLLDPETNIISGLKILRKEIDRHGLNWRAVASYHSPNPVNGLRYAQMVYGRLKGKSASLEGNAEIRAMLANKRLRGQLLLRRTRHRHFPFHPDIDPALIGQVDSLRKPVGMKTSRN